MEEQAHYYTGNVTVIGSIIPHAHQRRRRASSEKAAALQPLIPQAIARRIIELIDDSPR